MGKEGRDLKGKEKWIGLRSTPTVTSQNRNIVVGWHRVNQAWEGKAEKRVPIVARISLVHAFHCQQIALKPTGKVCMCVCVYVSHIHTSAQTCTQREILSDIQGSGEAPVEVVL